MVKKLNDIQKRLERVIDMQAWGDHNYCVWFSKEEIVTLQYLVSDMAMTLEQLNRVSEIMVESEDVKE